MNLLRVDPVIISSTLEISVCLGTKGIYSDLSLIKEAALCKACYYITNIEPYCFCQAQFIAARKPTLYISFICIKNAFSSL